jgi:hypothetical protein
MGLFDGDLDGDLLEDFNGLFHRLLEGDADGLKNMVSLMKGCCRWIGILGRSAQRTCTW